MARVQAVRGVCVCLCVCDDSEFPGYLGCLCVLDDSCPSGLSGLFVRPRGILSVRLCGWCVCVSFLVGLGCLSGKGAWFIVVVIWRRCFDWSSLIVGLAVLAAAL